MDGFFIYGLGLLGALGVGGGRVLWHRIRLTQSRNALAEELTRSGDIAVLSSTTAHGGLELATEEAGRTLSLQLLPHHCEFHAFDLGIDPSEHIELRVGQVMGSAAALVERAQNSTRVSRAVEAIFQDHWVVTFCGVREGALVVSADTQPLWTLQADTVRRRFQAVARLADALRVGLELRGQSELCPVCPGQKLVANVGHLHESVCGHCSGRFLPRDAVEQLVGGEMGLSVADLRDRIGDKRTQACPSCRTSMAPVMLDDTIGELCPGCGGMWLDSGELSALSLGRYDEIDAETTAA